MLLRSWYASEDFCAGRGGGNGLVDFRWPVVERESVGDLPFAVKNAGHGVRHAQMGMDSVGGEEAFVPFRNSDERVGGAKAEGEDGIA